MSFALLSTKLYIPPARENGIARHRLTEKLMAGFNQPGRFVLLSSPAGSGKTSLLAEWVEGLSILADKDRSSRLQVESPDQQPSTFNFPSPDCRQARQEPVTGVAWVSLDEGDNDPIRFWSYLIAACQMVYTSLGASAQSIMRAPQLFPADTIPTILINDLANIDRELILVLDDYHAINNDVIHTAFVFLLEHLPGNLHILIATRVDPPWPLARFRARNQMIEIRAQDLRFSIEEAAEFLNRTMGLNLSGEDVIALEARTEGWIAGLQLAALSMQGRRDIAEFVRAFKGSHIYVAEYLVEEILRRQAKNIQEFLLQTSILERLNAELCDAIAEIGDWRVESGDDSPLFILDSHSILEYLVRANLFLVPLDDAGLWFRYHHLFADLLQARLRQVETPDTIVGLHKRASIWYEQNGFAVEAVNHSLAARDFDEAARLVEKYAYPLMTRGELATCMRWMAALPDEVTSQRPLFLLAKAWALTFAGSYPQVEPLLQRVETLIQTEPNSSAGGEMLGSVFAMRAFFAMLAGEYERALEFAERAETLSPESSTGARSLLPYTLGAALRGQGQYEGAAQAFARDVQIGEKFDDLLIWVTGVTELINTRRMQGRLREAAEMGRQALRKLAERGAAQFGSLAKLEVALCEVLREQNELEEARERVGGAIARMQAWGMPTDRLWAYLILARIQISQRDFDGARESLQIARALRNAYPVLMNLARAVDIYEILLLISTQNIAEAEQLLESLHPGTSRIMVLLEQELTMLARMRLAQGRPEDAIDILNRLGDHPGIIDRKSAWLEMSALQVCALDALGDSKAALAVLTKTLVLAEPEGFVHLFVDEGEAMQQLLVAVSRQLGTATDQVSISLKVYVTKLLAAFRESIKPGTATLSIDKEVSVVERLSSRELEVLRLIATGDSNLAIAEKLVITVSAVKKHTANIYGKLSVNSRTQAVARARQLGLLP